MDRYTLWTDGGQFSFRDVQDGLEFQTPTGTRVVTPTDPNDESVYRATRNLPGGGIPQKLLDDLYG